MPNCNLWTSKELVNGAQGFIGGIWFDHTYYYCGEVLDAGSPLPNLKERRRCSNFSTQPKFVCLNETTMAVQVEDLKFFISHITILCKEILINIPIGSQRRENTWSTSNQYSDAFFAYAQQTCANITTGHIC